MIIVTPYLVKPAPSPASLQLPTDGFKPATDLDRILLGRQLAQPDGSAPRRGLHPEMREVMRAIAAALLLLARGRLPADPFDRPWTWSLPPTGLSSNDTNLRTMLVNPGDAVAGTGEDTSLAP